MSTQKQKMSRARIEETVNLLAKNLRLDDSLPSGTDLSVEEFEVVHDQIRGLDALPSRDRHHVYIAFSAIHLAALVHVLHACSRASQPKAMSTYIHILSLLPDPNCNPYLLTILLSDRAHGLPDIVGEWFLEHLHERRPSTGSLAPLCTLLTHFLFYCDMDMGDDHKSCFDQSVRYAITGDLANVCARPDVAALPVHQRSELQRLAEALEIIEEAPGNNYLSLTQDYKLTSISYLKGCDECGSAAAKMFCSQCNAVKYCGQECQMKAWKGKHKRKCWKLVDEVGSTM